MKKSGLFLLLLLVFCLPCLSQEHFFYFTGFETAADTVGWQFAERPKVPSEWIIGRGINRVGSQAMYVTVKGNTDSIAGYQSTTSGYCIIAYKQFHLAAGKYDMAFDFRINGDVSSNNDVMRVAFFPTTKPDGTPQKPSPSSLGSDFPQIAKLNPFIDSYGNQVFGTTGWKDIRGVVEAPKEDDYYVVFYFKESGGVQTNFNPGPSIDNFQLVSQPSEGDCLATPKNFQVMKDAQNVNLSWEGNATEYQLLYYSSSHASDTTYTVIDNIVAESYTIPLASIPEGCYTFMLRAVCEPDTGIWIVNANVLVYDPAFHCLDYVNLYAPGVTCTSGEFQNPAQNVGVVDRGYISNESMHTVHYVSDEYDRLTGYQLKTVPDGAVASVRLSNWTEAPSPSGSIEYTYTVQPDAKVLILRYAAVLQYAAHHSPEEQTRIHVEVLDTNDKLLSSCTEADFNAKDVAEGNTRGWRTYNPKAGDVQNLDCPIKWLDWAVLGINMKDYVGQKVKIRLTLYACAANFHFGYAYFVLDCSRGDIEGMSCGVIPTKFTVSEGFDYRWYRMLDGKDVPDSLLSEGGRVFTPLAGDTSSYFVDLMYPENHECKFTLNAYTLPRMPRSEAEFKPSPRDCRNIVDINNLSAVYSYPKNKPEVRHTDEIDTYLWDFGKYGTSQEKSPLLEIPLEGDTFTVILQTGYNNCYDTKEFSVEIPAIHGESYGKDTAHICEGESVEFNGKTYDKPGDYIDTLSTVYGCDSILSLHLKVLVPDTIMIDTMICSNETLEFFGVICDTSGVYIHHVPSAIGCDTLYYEMHLTVLDALEAALSTDYGDVCASEEEESFDVPYVVSRGMVTEFSVDYGDEAEAVGFVDVDSVMAGDGFITFTKPADARPGRYSSMVTFYNSDCGNLALPFDFDVKYPASVITQRWNDVLAVKNADNNGGYDFVSYQWYLDGAPVDGQTRPNYYTGGDLNAEKSYSVLLQRADDGVAVMSCPFVPQKFSADAVTEVSSVMFTGSDIKTEIQQSARAQVYTSSGVKIAEYNLCEGENTFPAPLQNGIYIVCFLYADGTIYTDRVVVLR